MKWFFPVIAGGLVLALGFTFNRAISSSRAAAVADQARVNELQVAQAQGFAGKNGEPDASSDAKPATAGAANQVEAAEAAPAVVEGTSKKTGNEIDNTTRSGDSPSTPISDVVKNKQVEPPNITIYPVKNHAAHELLMVLQSTWPWAVTNKIVADRRTNSLVLRDISGDTREELEAVLNSLDQLAGKPLTDQAASGTSDIRHQDALTDAVPKNRIPAVSDPASKQAAHEYLQYDMQAKRLASDYRQQQATSPGDAKKLAQLKSELQGAVHAAFHARQTWQRAQAAELRTRLEQIERRISERSQSSNEIIERRIDQLLHPEKQWESNDVGNGGSDTAAAGTPNSAAAESRPAEQTRRTDAPREARDTGNNNIGPPPSAETRPAAASQSIPARLAADGSLPESAVDVRKYLLDAEAALESAKAMLAEAKSAQAWSEVEWKRSQELYQQGALTERAARAAEADVERKKAALTRAETELQSKRRHLDVARQALATGIKLKEADLADAQLRLEHAAAELSRAEISFKEGIGGTQEQYETKKLAQQLAASQYERAKMIVDLYRKATPDGITFAEKGRAAGVASEDPSTRSSAGEPGRRAIFEAIDAAGDPRSRVLDAVHGVKAARAAVPEAEVRVAASEVELKRMQAANAKLAGTVPELEISRAQNSLASARAGLQSKRVDLDIKERQLEEAREILTGQIKLLEIDLADAKLRLENADNDLSRATQLLKTAAISKEEYETKRLAQRLGASQRERAQTLLDLYRKALPASRSDQPGKPPTTHKLAEPATQEKPGSPQSDGSNLNANEKASETPPKPRDQSSARPQD